MKMLYFPWFPEVPYMKGNEIEVEPLSANMVRM